METGCIFAARTFYEECENFPGCGCNLSPVVKPVSSPHETVPATAGPYQKDRNLVVDPKSTGRKEAARLYPLDRSLPCEWQGKKFVAFNGKEVWGCVNGLQANIHHGPDKNTLNNVQTNVSRICFTCHNHYHAVTDPDYDDEIAANYDPPTIVDATNEELIAALINRKAAKQGDRATNPND